MKEIFRCIRSADFKALFFDQSDNLMIQAFRYVFVGGISFLADWLSLYLLTLAGLYYLVSTAFAFLIGLAVNYFLSKKFVFVENPERVGKVAEFTIYGVIGVIGLLLTELLMYFFTDILGVYYLISKIIAAAIVLCWNFVARKLILYRKAKPTET